MARQEIVIKLYSPHCDKCRAKAIQIAATANDKLMLLMGDVSFDFRKEETIVLDCINGIKLKEKSSSKDDTIRAKNPQVVKIINLVGAEEKRVWKEKKIMRARKEQKIMHYSSNHNILLVGEGDFSFAACLARAFGSAPHIVATSLDSRGFTRNSLKGSSRVQVRC
ncbi:hypothetical protein CRG98_000779 [Punica granatum]|uniref:25S rRNA (uridine-N(3))-methyltransferase BMT5-like domain-containing protein n=1 Tax=Punica granatum TaxID=22663 RepID=A0A2I0LDS0_PUNGR|nr:hypothetical protein CRG98_000779 [Punica granatum]